MKWKCVRCGYMLAEENEGAAQNEGWTVGAFIEELISAQPALCPECRRPARPDTAS
jgi:hypothetical protein